MTRPRNLSSEMIAAVPSPYPASFDGSTLRYGLALFALLAITIVGGMLVQWMAREMKHGYRDAYPSEPLFAMRAIFLMAAITAVLRAGPEAAMMITWRESIEVATTILMVKRWCDAAAIVPAMIWMGLVFVFYPQICMSLVRISREDGRIFAPTIPRERMRRLLGTLVLILLISTLIAIGKRW